MFYLVRHGHPDYSQQNTKIYQGYGVNLAPLSDLGIEQIYKTAKDERLKNADMILSSPYTRAIHTAAILSKELGLDIKVETDLHEWVADKNYIYATDEAAIASYKEYTQSNGEYPKGEERPWETAELMRKRALAVLQKYKSFDKVIVACHGTLIQALTGKHIPANGEIVEYYL